MTKLRDWETFMRGRARFGVRFLLVTLAGCALAAAPAASAASPQALAPSSSNPFEGKGPLVPQIINGQESSIAQFPWQVYILVVNEAEGTESSCGGSILNATTILTAAHCTDHEGTTTPDPPEAAIYVVAGADHGLTFRPVVPSPGTYQAERVTSVRRDPYYAVAPEIKDDVAVLTLEAPLELSAARNSQPIPLVSPGATSAPGSVLSISGYGKEQGAEGVNSNGNLYSTNLTAISSDACRAGVGLNSAVLLCAVSPSSSTCQGDSGGPLTEGGVQVGIVDFGAKECPVGVPDVFTNIAAPEIRDFIEGSQAPPVAARLTSPPVIKPAAGTTPLDYSPLTCEPGAWSGSPTFSYSFQVENDSAQLLQSGPGNIFTAPSSLVGSPLVCIVQASNPGGVSTARSATTAAVAADTVPPTSSITGLACVKQACKLSIAASDPNAVALTLQSSATYSVIAKCPKKKKPKKGKKPVKQPVCHKTKTVPMSLVNPSAGAYTASVSGLPYSERITFSTLATNAAGLKSAAAVKATTLHKPKPKKPKKKAKKRK
jgi:secreted trypsin-like serine protease